MRSKEGLGAVVIEGMGCVRLLSALSPASYRGCAI